MIGPEHWTDLFITGTLFLLLVCGVLLILEQ
jgi:hypothetical protein